MMKILGVAWLGLSLSTSAVLSQTAVTTASPTTANTVPVFGPSSNTTVTNSPISVSGGNVGISTTGTGSALTVSYSNFNNGAVINNNNSGYGGSLGFQHSGVFSGAVGDARTLIGGSANDMALIGYSGSGLQFGVNSPSTPSMVINTLGRVGIGTASPGYKLTVQGAYSANQLLVSYDGSNGIFFQADGGSTHYNWQIAQQDLTGGLTLTPSTAAGGTTFSTPALTLLNSGSVGIGTISPQYPLDVTGAIHVTGVINATTSGVKYPDGNTQITAWTGVLCGGDYAEDVDPAGDLKSYAPGDVLVISDDAGGDVRKSSKPYSTMVAGIYATKPGVVGRRESLPKDAKDLPMAMVGIVPTKVTAENGPIHRGDLLVTSSTPGYAMKGTDRNRLVGAVIGKAMGSLDQDKGVIEVLVTLQ